MTETPTREELIALCERGIVPESEWHDRDSQRSQAKLGKAWALLRAGCDFRLAIDPVSDKKTWWIEIESRGFNAFEGCYDYPCECPGQHRDEDLIYLPTAARLDAVDGKDWY